MALKLMKLPFSPDALEPTMSKETLEYHYGKHHRNYVNTLNKLIEGTSYEEMDLEEIIQTSFESEGEGKIFNNAAQIWNHDFFWNCLSPNSQKFSGKALSLINANFNSLKDFKDKFNEAGKNIFGSGWVWLVQNPDQSLSIECFSNAINPLAQGQKPILTCDVWEHAYYLDYQNERPKFLNQFWKVVNWDFVVENLARESRGSRMHTPLYKRQENVSRTLN